MRKAPSSSVSCLTDTDRSIHQTAAEALGKIGEASGIPHLLPLLIDEPVKDVFITAAQALDRIATRNHLAIPVSAAPRKLRAPCRALNRHLHRL